MIVVYGKDNVMAVGPRGFAIVFVENDSVHSLESTGDPGCLRAVCERAEVFCRRGSLVCCVHDDNPKQAKLMRLYEKFGFKEVGRLMQKEVPTWDS